MICHLKHNLSGHINALFYVGAVREPPFVQHLQGEKAVSEAKLRQPPTVM
jgi:hypothetical protein